MKSKLLALFIVLFSIVAFSACTEEEINPTTQANDSASVGNVDIDSF